MKTPLALLGAVLALPVSGKAELLDPINLSPTSPEYLASGPSQSPLAWTFGNDADVWQIDLSDFAGTTDVEFSTWDWYPGYPDDYDLYWNGAYVGNSWTGNANVGGVFSSQGVAGINLLRVEYVNKHSGLGVHGEGSYYYLSLRAEPVPEPASLAALSFGILALLRRRRAA